MIIIFASAVLVCVFVLASFVAEGARYFVNVTYFLPVLVTGVYSGKIIGRNKNVRENIKKPLGFLSRGLF